MENLISLRKKEIARERIVTFFTATLVLVVIFVCVLGMALCPNGANLIVALKMGALSVAIAFYPILKISHEMLYRGIKG